MNREEVLKQLQSIFRDILKKDNVCIADILELNDLPEIETYSEMFLDLSYNLHVG